MAIVLKKQLTSDKLPPTMGVYYLTLMWKRSLQNFEAEYPDPLQFGSESNLDNGGHLPLKAVVTEEPPVPEATLELTYCGCKQTKCSTNRCRCHNIGFKCTALCGCLECCNGPNNNND